MMTTRTMSWRHAGLVSTLLLTLALPGCKRKPGELQVPSVPIDELQAPAGVLAYGGADNGKAVLDRVEQMVNQVMPMPQPLAAMAMTELQQKLQLTSNAGLDLTKPARFAVLDSKKYSENPLALIVGITSQTQLESTLPATKKKGDQGNAYSLSPPQPTVYLNFIGNSMVITRQPTVFADNKDFLARLAAAKIGDGFVGIASMENIYALYKTEMDKSIKAAQEKTSRDSVPGQVKEGMGSAMRWVQSAAADLKSARFAAVFPSDGAKVTLTARAKPGSNLEKSFGRLKAKPNTLYAQMPASTPAFMALNMDLAPVAEVINKLVKWSFDVVGSMGAMMPADKAKSLEGIQKMQAKLQPMMDNIWKAFAGDMLLGVHPLAGRELAIVGVYGVADQAALTKTMELIKELYQDPALVETYAKMGMKLVYKDADYKVGEVPVTVVKMETEAGKPGAGNPMAAMMSTVSSYLSWHMASAQKRFWFSLGPSAKATLEAHLSGKVGAPLDGAPGPRHALKNAAPGELGMLYVSPVELARLLLPEGNPMLAQLPKTQTGLALSFGSQAGSLNLVLYLPAEQIKGIGLLAAAVQGKMMGR